MPLFPLLEAIMIDLCTFTGLDNRTDLSRVAALSAEFPYLEFGVLLSRTPEDKDARYPEFRKIENIVKTLSGRARLALHVCGRAVGEFVEGASDIDDLVSAGIGRVQLNFSLPKVAFSPEELDAAINRTSAKVITQHFPSNSTLVTTLTSADHQVLYDLSGGRGIAATDYAPPFSGKYTGYAGGLGPENALETASAIAAVSGSTPVWIDMESRIRTAGYLDLDKCETVARVVRPLIPTTGAAA